ncbi:MAG: sulfur oxidation c-type cytochrome SoxX [Betaproteobacteria bacterium]|nr:sulfur oxidation c-type cytochrome SoxX [Betaproteobacteria bacterium]
MTLRNLLAGSALVVALMPAVQAQSSNADVLGIMKSSFKERGIAKLDRLDQNDLQKQCSEYSTRPMPAPMKAALEKAALDAVKYPADGNFLGDWKQGESIAQSGVGLQFSDNDKTVNGGNCYACHQISKEEISYGNIGPTLYQYGKLRGNTVEIQRYTWARIWNAHAFNACNIMPRFGAAGILTEEQIRHVMALLLDPTSPVNR